MVDQTTKTSFWIQILPAGFLTVATTIGLLAMMLVSDLDGRDELGVFFPPGTSLTEAYQQVVQAGGTVVRTGAWENVLVARFDGRSGDQITTSMDSWFLFDPVLAGACGVLPTLS